LTKRVEKTGSWTQPVHPPSHPNAQNACREESGVMEYDGQTMATYKGGFAGTVVTASAETAPETRLSHQKKG